MILAYDRVIVDIDNFREDMPLFAEYMNEYLKLYVVNLSKFTVEITCND